MSNTLSVATVLDAYRQGIFPMADSADADEIYWIDPPQRAILPLAEFHIARSLKKLVARAPYRVSHDRAFEAVLDGCRARANTWINAEIKSLFCQLAQEGHAHSIEVWRDTQLVGGLYGLQIGAGFCAESMFSRAPNASKFALIALVERLRAGGFTLLDCQFQNDHIQRFGVIEIARADYHTRLKSALKRHGNFHVALENISPAGVLQITGQTS